MKRGSDISDLAARVYAEHKDSHDYLLDTRKLMLMDVDHIALNMGSDMDGNPRARPFIPTKHFHRQLGEHYKIPAPMYDRLRLEYPDVLVRMVNAMVNKEHAPRLVRTVGKTARAFLSNRYRPRDNFDLFNAIMPVLATVPEMQVVSCELTETRLYIKVIFPRIQGDLKVGDPAQAGIVVSNSEIGMGGLNVEPLVYILSCLNGMISRKHGQRQRHVGGAYEYNEEVAELYRDETLEANDKAFWMKVQDVVRATIDEVKFDKILSGMRESMNLKVEGKVPEVMERVKTTFNLTEGEHDDVFKHLIEGGDLSAFGLMNAVTRAAQDVEDYDRATDLERLGGNIVTLSPSEWRKLAA